MWVIVYLEPGLDELSQGPREVANGAEVDTTSSASLIRMEMEKTILIYWSHDPVNSFTKQTNMYTHMGDANIHSSERMLQEEEMRSLINAMASKN